MQDHIDLLYLGSIPTETFIQEALQHKTNDSQNRRLVQILGNEVYRFMVKDDFQKRQIIKSKVQVEKFLKFYQKQFGEEISFSSMKQFNRITKKGDVHGYAETFMEMQGSQLFKYKGLRMKRMKFARRWYQKICQCGSEEFEEVDIFITREGILQSIKGMASGFLLFTSEFFYKYGEQETGEDLGIILYSSHRQIQLKAMNQMDYLSFLYFLSKALDSIKFKQTRYEATSFVKRLSKVDYLIDAQDYFQEVCHQIRNAKHEIFICGWWISPQLPLIRPLNAENNRFRLDELLKQKARKGIKINIIAFQSPPLIPNDSDYTIETLNRLSKNIKAISHPFKIIPGFWSHHEKLIIIDQTVALMGGLDLCYGRYDSKSHPISNNSQQMYPGIEYNNARIKDFVNVQKYQIDALPRNLPRMPWHDVALKVQGKVVADLSNHFIEYWNNSFIELLVVEEGKKGQFKASGIQTVLQNQQKQRKKQIQQKKQLCMHYKQSGKKMGENQQCPTDKPLKVSGGMINSFPTNMEEQSIKQKMKARQNFDKVRKDIKKKHNLILKNMDQNYLILSFESLGLVKLDEQVWQKKKNQYNDECQLLRSASQWSIGLEDYYNKRQNNSQRSIYNAYLEQIEKAQSFIYIENQFFISATGEHDIVKNRIIQKIYERIKRAVQKNQKFKVYVMMPLLPGMAGETDQSISIPMRLILHWQYQSICRGGNSIIEKVKSITSNPRDYIQFYGVRQHGILEGKPRTQLIYIHTKLMIIDDMVAICGSANINDRSMLGDRDSQICLIDHGKGDLTKNINGIQMKVCSKIHKLRVSLFQQHFGFINASGCEDPISEEFVNEIRQRAHRNTQIYRSLFGCAPDDNIRTYNDHSNLVREPSVEEYEKMKQNIIGHAVQFPFHFLQKQKLATIEPDLIHKIMT